jgi:ureidoglycolate hydrolase
MDVATNAAALVRLLIPAVAVAALTSCTADPAADPRPRSEVSQSTGTRDGHTQSPLENLAAKASRQARAVERSSSAFVVTVADAVDGDARATVRAFLRFAAHPTERSAAAVPFASSGITVTFGRDSQVIEGDALSSRRRWLLTNGVGSSSALFAVSNVIERNHGARPIRFIATTEPIPLCNDVALPRATPGVSQLFIAPGRPDGCAEGFEVTLDLDNAGSVKAVGLTVRSP